MKSKYTNKNGVKLLAAIMAFAMVLVTGFVVIGQDESYAEGPANATNVKTWTTSSTVANGDKYYIPTSSTTPITIPESATVTFYVMTGITLKVSGDGGGTPTVNVYAVSGAPVGDSGVIAFQKIAEVVVNATISAETSFTASDVSDGSTTTYASGMIEVEGSGVTISDSTEFAMKVVKTGSTTLYSKGAITDIKAGATDGPTSVVLNKDVEGIDVAIGSGNGTTNTNEFKLTGATLKEDLTVTFGTDNEVKVKASSGSNSTLTKGMLTITKGTVKVDTSLYLTPGTFAGVAPGNLGTALTEGELTAGLTLDPTSKKLITSAFVFNTEITSESGIKLAPGMAISFMQGSTYNGKVIGTTDSADGGVIDMGVLGDQAGRNVTIADDADGKLTVTAESTRLCPGSYNLSGSSVNVVTGSEFYVRSVDANVSFGLTASAVALADGFTFAVSAESPTDDETLSLTGWNVIVPKESTISLLAKGGKYALISAENVYVFGDIQGDEKNGGNITASSKDYYAKTNESTVKPFLAGTPVVMEVGELTAKGALYILSEAQEAGWDISEAKITWTFDSTDAAVYTTVDGTQGGEPAEIAIDAYKVPIEVKGADGKIIVVDGSRLIVSNSTVEADGEKLSMVLEAGSTLDIRNSDVMMKVDKDDKADVKVTTSVRNYEGASGPIPVGYMRELIVKGDISGCDITVYGKLTINDKAKLNSGSTIDIMEGGVFQIDGQLDVVGTVNYNPESTGLINGTMIIGTKDGGAEVNINQANVTVSKDGEVEVAAPKNNIKLENTLTVAESVEPTYGADGKLTGAAPYILTVEGTLDVRGTIAADHIYDKGTILVNGTSKGTGITIFDGVTLNIGSVNGTVTVTDTNIVGESKRTYATVSDGNEVVLENVTGLTITETVTSTTYVGADEKNYKFYLCNMDISGALGAAKGATAATITMSKIAYSADAKDYSKSNGKIEISQNLVLGKDVRFVSTAKNLVISGTITCVAEKASMVFSEAAKVSGSIIVKEGASLSDGLTGEEYLNAVEYVVSDNSGTITTTYTTFEAALGMIADADDKTIKVYGSVSTKEDSEIPAGMTVVIEKTLTVSKGSTVIAKVGSVVEGEKISVSGTFTSEDYQNDLDVSEIEADVISVNGDAMTWTSLDNALAIATPGSVITAAKNIDLGTSSTIPQGVTVQTEYDVTVKKNVVLTVAGTLTLTKGELEAESAAEGTSDVSGRVSVTETGVIGVIASGADEPAIFNNVSGVHFGKIVDSKSYFFLSNVNYAVSAIDEKLEGAVRIIGEVDLGNVTFAKTEKMVEDLSIVIGATSSVSKVKTVVTGDMKLVGATLDIGAGVKYTGSVTATANGADATVAFDKASGVAIFTYTDNAASTPIDYMYVTGDSAVGKMTIAAGTVTVGKIESSAFGAGAFTTDDGFTLIVGEGATLQVPASSTVTVGNNEKGDKATFVVHGNLVLKGKLSIEGIPATGVGTASEVPAKNAIVDIFGTVTISESGTERGLIVGEEGILNVLGTVIISDEAAKEGKLSNGGIIAVGSKPTTLGAAGTIAGDVTLVDGGYVLVYDGEVTGSLTDVDSTTVTINGVEYVKIIGSGDIREILDAADIELAGINGFVNTGDDKTKIYSDEAMTQEITDANFEIGEFDAIYFELDASVVKGLVSVGTGIEVFIDGANVGYGGQGYPLTVGTHTVDYNILTGYDGKNVVITFNGQTVQKGGQITITADMKDFSLIVTGATPAETIVVTPSEPSESDDGTGLTDYLLIVLVVLAAILVVIVAIRMLRN